MILVPDSRSNGHSEGVMDAMMKCLFFALVLLAPSAEAHHNSAPLYRFDELVTIEGIVTEFKFLNPHARVYFQVTNENGVVEDWLAEGANVIALRYNGWAGNEIRPGDTIVITGAPARDGSRRMEWREIVLQDGTVLGGGNNFPKERDELFEDLERQRHSDNDARR